MASSDNDKTERAGVNLVGYRVESGLGWIFREQPTSDKGVDAHIEIRDGDEATGRLVGAQIKTGESYFDEPSDDGWLYRPSDRHIEYWLRHSLPVYILLVNLAEEQVYWQLLDASTIQTGKRGGKYVHVPAANTLSLAKAHWEQAASIIGAEARQRYPENLDHLPPSVARKLRDYEESERIAAEWLAAHLAQGRAAPDLTVRTLIVNSPGWLDGLGADAWVVIGNFAHCHGADFEAADAFQRAADLDPARAGRMKFSAGIALSEADAERARSLLSEAAQSEDAALLGELGLELLERGADPELAANEQLAARLRDAEDDVVILCFRAHSLDEGGDRDGAIALFERALELDQDSTTVMLGLARQLGLRAITSSRRTNDLERALILARQAVDQLHKWSGPSVAALNQLLHLLLIDNAFGQILDRALPAPMGRATHEESVTPEVIVMAVLAADSLEDADLVGQLLDKLPPGIQRDFASASLLRNDRLPPDERRVQWEGILEQLDVNYPRELVVAVSRLAHLGIDRTDQLDPLVQEHRIAAEQVEFIRAIAVAFNDLEAGLPALRALADTDQAAAQSVIRLLEDGGRIDAAIAAAADAADRLGDPRFSLMQAELLCREGNFVDAAEVIEGALVNPALSQSVRPDTHAFLARVAARTGNWPDIQQHCEAALAAGTPGPRTRATAWLLAEAHLALGRFDLAVEVINEHGLVPESPGEAWIWASAMSAATFSEELAVNMIDLAERFSDDVQLSANLLMSVVMRTRDAGPEGAAGPHDERVPIADETRRRAIDELGKHVDTHGAASPIRKFQSDSADELRDQLIEELKRSRRPIGELLEQAARGEIPQGLLALLSGHTVAYALAGRLLGMYVAGSFLDADCAIENESVASAINDEVVVDTSALLVASLLSDMPTLRGHFRRLLMPRACLKDLRVARAEMNGLTSSSGTMGWDHDHERPVYFGPEVDQQLASIRRFGLLEAAVERVVPIDVDELPSFSSFNEDDRADHVVWLGPVELAKTRGVALWSDDVVLRKLARSMGVRAFGTLNLLEYLAEQEINKTPAEETARVEELVEARRKDILTAIRERVVEVPIEIDDLIAEAKAEQFAIDFAQCTIGRPAWWIWSDTPYNDLNSLFSSIDDPGVADMWREIAMNGAALLARWDRRRAGIFIALAAMVGRGSSPNPRDVANMLRTGRELAARHQAEDPISFFHATVEVLVARGVATFADDIVDAIMAELDES